jgi:heat-inducible transcriptional repressor
MIGELSDREKVILRYIIEDFISSANPIGSQAISQKKDVNLSSATIRNVMSELEELNYITQPHTSGGRIPTDKGYRFFVNELMGLEPLNQNDKNKIKKQVDEVDLAGDEIYKEVSKILGKLSREISIVSQPYFSEGVFEKLELIDLSSNKLLVVVSIKSGHVRTLLFDVESEISRDRLDRICRILNEKLGGLSLIEIRNTYSERIGELRTEASEIVKVFVDSIDKIFQDESEGVTLYIGGTTEILSQPEFGNTDNYRNIIELTDDKHVVFHVLNNIPTDSNGLSISIGGENTDNKLKDYSIISTSYSSGTVKGRIALIGPRRMNYSKMVSMLNYTSKVITERK